MVTNSALDLPAVDGIQRAFRLPTFISEDDELSNLYTEVAQRLRDEARGLPMTTMQIVLIERISTKYVTIKYHEDRAWAGMSPTAERDLNAQWSDLVKEFNRVLAASQDKLRDQMMDDAVNAFIRVINENVISKEERQQIRIALSGELEKIGM